MWQVFLAAAFLLSVFLIFHEPEVAAYPLKAKDVLFREVLVQ